MIIRNILLSIAGKDNFDMDNRIGILYILRLCWKYGWMMVRGIALSLTSKKISESIFVGKRVKIYERRYLSIGKKTKIHDNVKIDALSTSGVSIGERCVIGRDSVIECTGSLSSIGMGLEIGNDTSFGSDCFFGAAGGIHIGNDVIAGQYVRFHSENHNYDSITQLIREQGVSHKGIRVGNNCWIGSGVVFLDGAKIGDGCIVAANSVVTNQFGDNVIIAGMPAKVIKNRGQKDKD